MACELTILVPAFNEAGNLERNLPVLQSVAQDLTDGWEILVVDDGSVDSTPGVVREAAKSQERIRLVSHKVNMGPGAGIYSGLFWSRGKWVLFVPADLACVPGHLARMWKARTGADLVVGLRSDRRDYSMLRKFMSVSYIGLIRAFSGTKVRQFNYIQMWRRSLFRGMELSSKGVFITAEVILRAQRKSAGVVQVGMEYIARNSGRSSGARPGVVARCVIDMVDFFAFGE